MTDFPKSGHISRHTVMCRAAQENGAHANGSEYIKGALYSPQRSSKIMAKHSLFQIITVS